MHSLTISTLIMAILSINIIGKENITKNILINQIYFYSLDSETRSLKTTFNPMCEVFPNVSNNF